MKRILLILAALLAVAVVAAACGGAATTAPAPQAAATTAPAAPTAAPAAKAATEPTKAPAAAATTAPAAATSAPAAGAATKPATPPTNTPIPTQESPAGQKIGKGVATAAELDAIDLTGKNVDIVFWNVFTGAQQQAIKQVIEDFQKQYPNIRVTSVYKGNYNDMYKSELTAIAGNAVPDAVWSYPNQIAEYAREDVSQPLDPFMQSSKYGLGDLSKQIDQWVFDAYKYPDFNNQILSLPPAVSQEVMYYNADLLKQLGYDKPPETWAQFAEVCAKLKTQMPDKQCFAFRTDASSFALQVWARGGELLSADRKAAAFDKAGLETMQWYKDMLDKGYGYQPGQQFGEQTDFGLGKTLFTFGTSTGVPFYKQAITDQATNKERFTWGIAAYPHSTAKPVVNLFGPSYSINKTTPERELAAWLFLKYWMSAQPSGTWATIANYFPVNKEGNTSPAVKTYLEKNPVYAKGFDLLQYGRSEPSVAGWQESRDAITQQITGVITGKSTPEQANAAAMKAVTDAVNRK
ncbi:MAG: ABC transporter substrate-binding protein [Anaerolineae bacterium]